MKRPKLSDVMFWGLAVLFAASAIALYLSLNKSYNLGREIKFEREAGIIMFNEDRDNPGKTVAIFRLGEDFQVLQLPTTVFVNKGDRGIDTILIRLIQPGDADEI